MLGVGSTLGATLGSLLGAGSKLVAGDTLGAGGSGSVPPDSMASQPAAAAATKSDPATSEIVIRLANGRVSASCTVWLCGVKPTRRSRIAATINIT
jgi:hypothetical protein